MKISVFLHIFFVMTALNSGQSQSLFAVSNSPAPVLNTPDFEAVFGGYDGKSLKTDEQGLIREIEFIAFEGTTFRIIGEIGKGGHKIFQVTADNYQYGNSLYIDSRFADIMTKEPPKKTIILPSKKEIYSFLDKAIGSKYIWGGNYISGIEKMLEYYAPSKNLDPETKQLWCLKGCDCSGLMYEATHGYTERNTSKLVYEGEPVFIEGLAAEEIAEILEPLDMIVWAGHVIYVYDENTTIQSALSKGGVVKTDLIETLKNVMKTRKPADNYDLGSGDRFVVRRWYK